MLVNKIMQVLKNLFGLNKKISASEIAIKDSNNNVYTLDDYLKMGSIKFNNLWKGSVGLDTKIAINDYNNYDMLLILVQTSWNRNGYIILPKTQYKQNKNFEIALFCDTLCTYGYNPVNLPNISISRLLGNGDAEMTEIIGINF